MPLANCFVIMSFEKGLLSSYRKSIKAPIESLGLHCYRYDELNKTGEIYPGIIEEIRRSFILVADFSSDSPNCYYELGFADALGWERNVILLNRAGKVLPFNLRGRSVIDYRSRKDLATRLVATIKQSFLSTSQTRRPKDPCLRKFGGGSISATRVLTACFDYDYKDREGDAVYDIQVQVEALPGAAALTGDVKFHLHPSYGEAPQVVQAANGIATYVIPTVAGAFTVGAVADEGKTRLEFDLGKLPGAVESFYDPSLQQGSTARRPRRRTRSLPATARAPR